MFLRYDNTHSNPKIEIQPVLLVNYYVEQSPGQVQIILLCVAKYSNFPFSIPITPNLGDAEGICMVAKIKILLMCLFIKVRKP